MAVEESKSKTWIIYLLVILAIFAMWYFLPVTEWITALREWTTSQGLFGALVFACVYALACLVFFPGSVLTLAAGLAYGLAGFPIVIAGATVGASLSFLAGRYLFRDRVQGWVSDNPKLKAVDRAVEEDGWKVVGLLRLSPAVPFNLQNWFFGITSVSFWPYALATFFGIMPGTLLYLWIASLGGEAASGGTSTSTLKYVFFGVGIVATIAVTWIVGRKANQKLKEYGVEEKQER